MGMRRGAFANLYFSPPDLWRAVFVPCRFRFAPCRLRAAFAPCRLRAAKLSSRRVAGVFFADALQAALAPYSLAGGFCALFSCAALRSRTRGAFCAACSAGGRVFLFPVLAGRAEFLPIIAHRRQKGKAICRQNLFRPKTPPSAHKTHSLFSQRRRFAQHARA